MKAILRSRLLICWLPLVTVAGCGGGSTDSANQMINELGAANPTEIEASIEGTPVASMITGRVADGYLQGATVCIDINENGACDSDEPFAISGVGGSYTLNVPNGAENKPVVADVPPEAIDEDTGQPIGKQLLLSTPADRPEFISPITTLVFEELKNNPALDTESAEESVLEALGLTSEDETSLFDDYIEEQDDDDTERAERFRHLHQTARVVANLLDDIQNRVESAAIENGIDTEGDDDTREAIHQFVRQEVRDLLPEISLAVAEEILGQSEAAAGSDLTVASVDPDKVAGKLIPDDIDEGVLDKIDTIRELGDIERANMKEILTAGMYWIEVDCEHGNYEHDIKPQETPEPIEVVLNDEGIPTPVDLPVWCSADYGHILVEGDDNSFSQTQYSYNDELGIWEQHDDHADGGNDVPHIWRLSNGEWVAASGDSPEGSVEFLDDGGAVVSTGEGKLLVYAGELDLTGTPVGGYLDALDRGHILVDEAQPVVEVPPEDGAPATSTSTRAAIDNQLFPEDASAYFLNIKRRSTTHVLFNWHAEDEGDFSCVDFGGNCNVVDLHDETGFNPLQSLAELQEYSVDGAELAAIMYSDYEDRPIDLRLYGEQTADGSLPVSGKATWFMPGPEYPYEIKPAPGQEPVPDDQCQPVKTDPPLTELPEPVLLDAIDGEVLVLPEPCVVEDPGTAILADQQSIDESSPTDQTNDRVLGHSPWKLVDVDGVVMLEVGIPVAVRHAAEDIEAASLLLIEHEGFVRRGARLAAVVRDLDVMYSNAAFETLLPYAEDYVSAQSAR